MSRFRELGRSSVGKKAISAASGLVLLGFVLAHMFANLQIFAGGGRIDAYARGLRASPVLLWSVRALLAAAFGAHVVVALQLAARRRAARGRVARAGVARTSLVPSPPPLPIPSPPSAGERVRVRGVRRRRAPRLARSALSLTLSRRRERGSDLLAARAMLASGLVLAVFVLVHLANLTWGVWHPSFVPLAVHHNVVALFKVRAWSAFYLIALVALAIHAAHGAWSAPQSLGITPERGAPGFRRLARGAAVVIATGLFAVVVAVLVGVVR
jgi:succinate dehydrogenase / fumarate reductase cytochrome b subunit